MRFIPVRPFLALTQILAVAAAVLAAIPAAPARADDRDAFFSTQHFFTFFARHHWDGCHIYQSNGTATGTRRILELWMGLDQCTANVQMLGLRGASVLMVNSAGGWSTTQPGVYRLRPGASPVQLASRTLASAVELRFVAMEEDGVALFIVRHYTTTTPELWRTDGTAAGTRRVMMLQPPGEDLHLQWITAIFRLQGRWLMMTNELTGHVSNTQGRMFALDFGARRVRPVFNFRPDAGQIWWAHHPRPDTEGRTHAIVGPRRDRMVFFRYAPAYGVEPWVTDGTRDGTRRLRDIFTGPNSSINVDHDGLIPFGNRALFVASTQAAGDELWITDGTPEGTRIVRNINPGAPGSGISVDQMAMLGDRLYFAATSRGERGLWVTDGTATGTRRVAATFRGERLILGPLFHHPFPVHYGRRPIAAVNGRIFFAGFIQRGDCPSERDQSDPLLCTYEAGIFRYNPTSGSVARVVQTTRYSCYLGVPQQGIAYREIGGEYQSLTAFRSELLFGATDRPPMQAEPECGGPEITFDMEPWRLSRDVAAQVANIARGRDSSRPAFIGTSFCRGLC